MDYRTTAAKNTILLGILLTILGAGTFALIRVSPARWAALLPALFGILFLLLGVLAQKKKNRYRIIMYSACGLAFAAIISAAGGLMDTAALIAGQDIERPAAAVEEAISAVLCAGFLLITIKAFIAEKRVKIGEGA